MNNDNKTFSNLNKIVNLNIKNFKNNTKYFDNFLKHGLEDKINCLHCLNPIIKKNEPVLISECCLSNYHEKCFKEFNNCDKCKKILTYYFKIKPAAIAM